MRFFKNTLKTVFLILILLFIFSHLSDGVRDITEQYVSIPLRELSAALTNLVSVSLFEVFVLSSPAIIFAALWWHKPSVLLAFLCFALVSYSMNIGIPALAEDGRVAEAPTEQECSDALTLLRDKLNGFSELDGGESCSIETVAREYMNQQLGVELKSLPKIKTSLFTPVFERVGTLGYFAFPTAEIALTDTQPQFMRPFVATHELMHFAGITAEDSASLHAYAALVSSGTPCYEFSAYFTAFTYIGAQLYSINSDSYYEIYKGLSPYVRECLAARHTFLAVGEGSMHSEIYGAINDAAISLRDKRGGESYSSTASLLVDYILK